MNKPHFRRVPLVALLLVLLVGQPLLAQTNVPPTPVVLSALQRPGTTYMDIDFRVNDPDDATVEVYALGFVNGGTTFADIVKISTLVEGTEANVGTNIPANTNLRLTWNVAADWNTNFGNVQVEILAKDGRGLLPFHWITLPTNGPNPEITINRWPITDSHLLPLWYWLIAKSDPAIALVDGRILGVGADYDAVLLAPSFNSIGVAVGTATTAIGREVLFQRFDIRSLSGGEINRAKAGRYGFQSLDVYSVAPNFNMPDRIYAWGGNGNGQIDLIPQRKISAVALGYYHSLILSDSTVIGYGLNSSGQTTIPSHATNVTAIAAGFLHSIVLRADGSVLAWGYNNYGQISIPATATNIAAIAAGMEHNLALRLDGSLIGWGYNNYGQNNIPATATNIIAIAAGANHNLALRADGSVLAWGYGSQGLNNIPATATNIIAIAAGANHNLALRTDGSVLAWGRNAEGQISIPATATNITAIAAGFAHSLALRGDGSVIVWGDNTYRQLDVPPGMAGIDVLGVGCMANHIVVVDKRTP